MNPRHALTKLNAALDDTPVVLIHGPRQCGKSTLARSLCAKSPTKPTDRRYITLDDSAELYAARNNPRGYIERLAGPVVIDEVQRAPELLIAIKMDVDEHRRPGRFLLTGSANVLLLPQVSDSLAGRMEIIRLWPLSQSEIEGRREQFIERIFSSDALKYDAAPAPPDPPDPSRTRLIDRIVRGGFPEAVSRPADRRTEWFESYIESITQRDIRELAELDRLIEVPRLLHLLASRAGGLLNNADLSRTLGLSAATARRHLGLLEMTFQAVVVPAWSTNLGLHLAKSGKVYIGDSGLAAALLENSAEGLLNNPTLLGHIFENFVAIELSKLLTWSRPRVGLHHYRTVTGQEVDLLLEDRAGRVVGIEVKASKSVASADFRGLRALKSKIGDKFHRGLVLYTGDRTLGIEDNLEAVPVDALWQ